ncbi:hypothetical protein ACKS0A_09321 [Histoplasma ohiense]
MSLTVLASKTSKAVSNKLSSLHRVTTCIAEMESPPRLKKSSLIPTASVSMPMTRAIIFRTLSSRSDAAP